jgi:hypothetical protein
MRVPTAKKYDLLRAGHADVGDEPAAPAQVPVILLARERRPAPHLFVAPCMAPLP